MKACIFRGIQAAFFPKHVRACQRGVAAKVHLDARRKPAEMIAAILRNQKCCLREIHFACHITHPLFFGRCRENTNGCGISSKWPAGKGIHLSDGDGHNLFSLAE